MLELYDSSIFAQKDKHFFRYERCWHNENHSQWKLPPLLYCTLWMEKMNCKLYILPFFILFPLVHCNFAHLLQSLQKLNWKRISFVANEESNVQTSIVKRLIERSNLFWKVIPSKKFNCNDTYRQYVWLDKNQSWIDHESCRSFKVLTQYIPESTQRHAGFYLTQNKTVLECYLLVNELEKSLKCFELSSKRRNFQGFQLKSLYGFTEYDDVGFCTSILNEVSNFVNLTIQHDLSNKTKWGSTPLPGKNWTSIDSFEGIYHDFVQEKYDFAANFWLLTLERQHTTDFLVPFVTTKLVILLNATLLSDAHDATFFLRPLATQTWITFMVIFEIIAGMRKVIFKYFDGFTSKYTLLLGKENFKSILPYTFNVVFCA